MIKLETIQEYLEEEFYLDMATSDLRFSYVLDTYTKTNKKGLNTLTLMHNAHFSYCSQETSGIGFSAFQRSVYRSAEKVEIFEDFLSLCDLIVKHLEEVN